MADGDRIGTKLVVTAKVTMVMYCPIHGLELLTFTVEDLYVEVLGFEWHRPIPGTVEVMPLEELWIPPVINRRETVRARQQSRRG